MQPDIQNGVNVYQLAPDASVVIKRKGNVPLVTICIAARGVAQNESVQTAGLTGLMSRASIKGTTSRTGAEIADAAERMGGSISPSLSADIIDWEISVPARHFQSALELLADVVFNAAFRDDEFEIERKLMLADLQHSRDDMYRYPMRLCMQQAFRDHPYGKTIAQIERAVTSATPAAIAAQRDALMRNPWAFVVGDIDPDTAATAIADLFPSATQRASVSMPEPEWHGGETQAEERDKAQTALAIAFPGPKRNDSDVYPLQVLTNAVGGLGGRFFEELRSKRSLAYSVALMPVARWLGGAFTAYIATAPEREDEARRGLLEQFERLVNEPLEMEEVRRSQRYTIGAWQIRNQTNSAQLSELMYAYLLGPGIQEILEFEERILAVTPKAMQDTAARYFNPNLAVQGIVRGKDQNAL